METVAIMLSLPLSYYLANVAVDTYEENYFMYLPPQTKTYIFWYMFAMIAIGLVVSIHYFFQ